VVVVLAVGGVGYAAIPSSSGVFRGCYARTDGLLLGIPHSKGDLRLVDEGESCRSYETLVSWNQTGPQGATGPTGAQGPAGPQGPAGSVTGLGTNTGNAAAGTGAECTLGEVLLTASPAVGNGTPALGQVLPINQNVALFALLGTTYGGDGRTTFALPDLRPVTPNNMTYTICTQGRFPSRN
jgi:hypothetical protein